jgi:C4-dicarboxylate-specific signal transduction histidine kinase
MRFWLYIQRKYTLNSKSVSQLTSVSTQIHFRKTPSAFIVMNATNPSTTISLSVVDDDSRRLAIIYGTLGTMLALASLAFAALTWARSRRHQCEVNSKTRAATDRALESNEVELDAHEAYELEGSAAFDCVVAGIR